MVYWKATNCREEVCSSSQRSWIRRTFPIRAQTSTYKIRCNSSTKSMTNLIWLSRLFLHYQTAVALQTWHQHIKLKHSSSSYSNLLKALRRVSIVKVLIGIDLKLQMVWAAQCLHLFIHQSQVYPVLVLIWVILKCSRTINQAKISFQWVLDWISIVELTEVWTLLVTCSLTDLAYNQRALHWTWVQYSQE